MLVQRIEKVYSNEFEMAKKYYSILFMLNNVKVTPKELDLISFSAVKGTLSTPPVRDEFIKSFTTPQASVYNMMSRLQKMKLLIKDENQKVRVNPKIQMDFTKPEYMLAIKISKLENSL